MPTAHDLRRVKRLFRRGHSCPQGQKTDFGWDTSYMSAVLSCPVLSCPVNLHMYTSPSHSAHLPAFT